MYANIKRHSEKDVEALLARELGPRYAAYRAQWRALQAGGEAPPFPIHIDFELVDACNQRCVMCPRNPDAHPDVRYRVNTGARLSLDDFHRVIDEGAPRGLLSINLGAFAEPLLHPDVFAMVRYAHERGVVDSRLITNGLLLDRHTEEAFSSGLVNLFVSLDAFTPKTYRKIRGAGFSRVRANLISFLEQRKARRRSLPVVRVSFVDMPSNTAEKEDFIAFWRDRADMIDIQIYDDFNARPGIHPVGARPKKWDCRSPWARVAVLADGTILPCCSFNGRALPIGSLRSGTIAEAWGSAAMRSVRSGILSDKLPDCHACQRG
ncbi:MAG: radical SAM protein [Elusimicrobia bacterium]|nr:radical SAM protein [Elusimicrobiota bacterium]